MGFKDDIKHGAQSAMGKAKEAIGDATDNKSMEFDGKKDQASADVKNTGADARDGAKAKAVEAEEKLPDDK